jgi:hypothetical protein
MSRLSSGVMLQDTLSLNALADDSDRGCLTATSQ